MKLEFHPEAIAEYTDAALYYASCQPGLDVRFMTQVESAFTAICADPLRWRVFSGEIRRSLVRVFPYAILYTLEPDHVLVIAVMHCRREPGYWHDRR